MGNIDFFNLYCFRFMWMAARNICKISVQFKKIINTIMFEKFDAITLCKNVKMSNKPYYHMADVIWFW